MRTLAILLALCSAARAAPQEPDDLAPPPPERGNASQAKVALPQVPAFTLATYADGSHTVQELRVRGATLLDTKVTVRGVITWVYDCAIANRTAGETDRALAKRIGDDPTLCERPKFYIGDARDTSPEKSLWVVDVPRPYNKLELARIAKADRTMPDRCEARDPASVCPPYRVGDVVTVTGDFKVSSPHSERNSDGLLVYAAMENVTSKWTTPGTTWTAKPGTTKLPMTSVSIAVHPGHAPSPPMRAKSDPKQRAESMKYLNTANRALGGKQPAAATAAYQQALAAWPGNHLAWFGLGGALAMQARWRDGADAFTHAAELRPDAAMYAMWLGVAQYEASVIAAREDRARKENRKPEEIIVDLSTINFDKPQHRLVEALQLDGGLWRAQFYLGRIARAQNHSFDAAEDFTHAIAANPREAAPYIALGELYRKWDYTDEAIVVASAGAQNVPGSQELTDIDYVLGMAYDDKRLDAKAIEAFTKALDASPDNVKAKFQRGQVYYRIHDRAKAKADLESFLKAAPPALEFAKQQASMMLMDLAATH